MLQNVDADNVRVPKRKVFRTETAHNIHRHKRIPLQNQSAHYVSVTKPICDAVCFVTLYVM
jgi:hypothetical protein